MRIGVKALGAKPSPLSLVDAMAPRTRCGEPACAVEGVKEGEGIWREGKNRKPADVRVIRVARESVFTVGVFPTPGSGEDVGRRMRRRRRACRRLGRRVRRLRVFEKKKGVIPGKWGEKRAWSERVQSRVSKNEVETSLAPFFFVHLQRICADALFGQSPPTPIEY